VEAFLPFAGMLDLEAERRRIAEKLAGAQSELDRLEGLLGGEFAQRAPREVVARERAKLNAVRETATKLEAQLNDLE
jgi:valyl-tRNA synthetase